MAKEAKEKLQQSIQNAKDGVPNVERNTEESKTTGEWRRHATKIIYKQLDSENKNASDNSAKVDKAHADAHKQKKEVWDGLNINLRHNWWFCFLYANTTI